MYSLLLHWRMLENLVVYGEEEVIFTCTTRFSNILQWSSREYIGGDGYNIQIYNGTLGTDVRRGSTHATLVRAEIENGVLVLVSELRIRVSTQYPTATIQCDNNGHGARESITFGMCHIVWSNCIHVVSDVEMSSSLKWEWGKTNALLGSTQNTPLSLWVPWSFTALKVTLQ